MQGQTALLAEIFGKVGKNCVVCAPLYVDYGKNTEIGEGFFANYNFVVLDVAKVTIGNDVFCGPNVTLTTAGHPVHYEPRNSRYEYGIPIEIGDNVWLGANVVVNPGASVGANSVIGSGSVVTGRIPPDVVAAGNPAASYGKSRRKIKSIITKNGRSISTTACEREIPPAFSGGILFVFPKALTLFACLRYNKKKIS